MPNANFLQNCATSNICTKNNHNIGSSKLIKIHISNERFDIKYNIFNILYTQGKKKQIVRLLEFITINTSNEIFDVITPSLTSNLVKFLMRNKGKLVEFKLRINLVPINFTLIPYLISF